jgi:hypothetical protein
MAHFKINAVYSGLLRKYSCFNKTIPYALNFIRLNIPCAAVAAWSQGGNIGKFSAAFT